MDSIKYYDNSLESDPNDPNWLDIERIYCLDWDSFSPVDWSKLENIYAALPGAFDNTNLHSPLWFSLSEDIVNGYLCASVEPPGLQVYGTLRRDNWERWHDAFICAITALPFRKISKPWGL